MRLNSLKAIVKTALRGAAVLLLGAGVAPAQQTINLSAGPTTATLPDGNAVPMWGYACGAVVSTATATCAKLNPAATGWSPVVITVPVATTGSTSLTISLTNNLTFGANSVPTSLTIVGQLGGGLGTTATSTPSPAHGAQSVTWPIVDPTTTNTPPPQGNRVQSFSTEVAAGATTALTWASLRPGTYLIESGTHPSIQGPWDCMESWWSPPRRWEPRRAPPIQRQEQRRLLPTTPKFRCSSVKSTRCRTTL